MAATGSGSGATPKRRVLLGLGLGAMLAMLVPPAASSDEALDRASVLASEKRYRQARAVLDPVLERDADHPRARLLDGFLRAHEGRIGEAIEIFDRLRRDHPDMSEAWNNLAVLYAAEGRLHEARETLSAALERKPSAIGYANLGDIYANLARRAYGRARELGSDVGTEPDTAASPAPGSRLRVPRRGAARAERPPAEPAGAPAHPGGRPAVCLRAGGFEDRGDLSRAQEWLESHGAEVVELHLEKHREVRSHRVYLPPLEDRAKAVAKVREIRARGVNDVAVIGRARSPTRSRSAYSRSRATATAALRRSNAWATAPCPGAAWSSSIASIWNRAPRRIRKTSARPGRSGFRSARSNPWIAVDRSRRWPGPRRPGLPSAARSGSSACAALPGTGARGAAPGRVHTIAPHPRRVRRAVGRIGEA